jgi:hypothetical protein
VPGKRPRTALEGHILAASASADQLGDHERSGCIRFPVVDPDQQPTSERAKAAQELIDVVRVYLK